MIFRLELSTHVCLLNVYVSVIFGNELLRRNLRLRAFVCEPSFETFELIRVANTYPKLLAAGHNQPPCVPSGRLVTRLANKEVLLTALGRGHHIVAL